jgi:flagellar protein FlaJ
MRNAFLGMFLQFSRIAHPRIRIKAKWLRSNLIKASMKISYQAFIGITVFTSILTSVTTLTLALPLFLHFNLQLVPTLLLSVLVSVGMGLGAVAVCYAYPLLVISSRARSIDANLPLIANFMAVLASSGMPPESIFNSLAKVSDEFAVEKEIANVIRDIKLMGVDLHTALKNASEYAPSTKLGAMLDGMATTAHMGGDLAGYLRDQADKFKRERMMNLRQFLDNLSVIAEAYVTFLVAAPLMLIVMLSVLSFLQGEVSIISLDPKIILNVLAFIIIPTGISLLILAVDYLNPKR